jgi:hypothetical protein
LSVPAQPAKDSRQQPKRPAVAGSRIARRGAVRAALAFTHLLTGHVDQIGEDLLAPTCGNP